MKERIEATSTQINELSTTVAVMDENLSELKDVLDSKLRLYNGGNEESNNNPVIVINRAIQSLQDEIRQIHMQITVCNHDLWQVYKQRQYTQFVKQQQQGKQRRGKRNGGNRKSSSTASLASDNAVTLEEDDDDTT